MRADLAIQTEALSKRYALRALPTASYRTIREDIARLVRHGGRSGAKRETIWALDDVSLEIAQGEVVGIIGRNGSGKSTLLKILSRITEPTRGHADVRGRLGSLLEVGTGFHPELTGRENIFLNGAILGMRRSEIVRKFDDIVEFSGVSKFIDTPVKRFSNGMYVRLAFSVAAHLEPEILLIDEVLAVGDAEFQRRCLGRMDEIGRSGRTVLFVSHSMPTITRLCERAILLDKGRLIADGPAEAVVARYLSEEFSIAPAKRWSRDEAPGDRWLRLNGVRIVNRDHATTEWADIREPVGIEFDFDILQQGAPVMVPWIELSTEFGDHVFSAMDTDPAWTESRPAGSYVSTAWIPANLLNEGAYTVTMSIRTFVPGDKAIRHADAQSAIGFQVVDQGEGGSSRGTFAGTMPGLFRPLLEWQTDVDGARTSSSIL